MPGEVALGLQVLLELIKIFNPSELEQIKREIEKREKEIHERQEKIRQAVIEGDVDAINSLLFLTAPACRPPKIQTIVLGDARVTGKIIDGQIHWTESTSPNKAELHYIVTKGFITEVAKLQGERDTLKLEVKKLRELLEKKPE